MTKLRDFKYFLKEEFESFCDANRIEAIITEEIAQFKENNSY